MLVVVAGLSWLVAPVPGIADEQEPRSYGTLMLGLSEPSHLRFATVQRCDPDLVNRYDPTLMVFSVGSYTVERGRTARFTYLDSGNPLKRRGRYVITLYDEYCFYVGSGEVSLRLGESLTLSIPRLTKWVVVEENETRGLIMDEVRLVF